MTPNDHRAALFDALRQCERSWGKSLTQPSSAANRRHDEAREQHHAAVEALVRELEKAHDQINRLSLDLHVLDKRVEAVGAGGNTQSTDARWYAVSADGMATLCINREDARDTAAEAAQLYPNNAPYTAVQMVPAGAGEAFGSRS